LKSTSNLLARGVIAASLMFASQQVFAFEDAAAPPQTEQTQPQQNDAKCHWWQFGHCNQQQVEGLPSDAPNVPTLITVDLARNEIYLFENGQLVDKSPVASGSEKILRHGNKVWLFHTPRGELKVLRKIKDPIWTKPDWAFIEDGDPVPPPDSPKRQVKGHLGKYALDLGDGYMIHGTDNEDSIGKRVSHGCIRVPGDMLQELWNATTVGTPVYIFESQQTQTAANGRHSDLD